MDYQNRGCKYPFRKNFPNLYLIKRLYNKFCSNTLNFIRQPVRHIQKTAFSLSEVLIALVIIGVIAAITIPICIEIVNKRIWVEGLKVAVSVCSQGFRNAMVADGVTDLRDTELAKACNDDNGSGGYISASAWKKNCQPIMSKYFVNIKFENVDEMKAQGDKTNIITDTEKCKQLVGKTNKWWYLNDKTKCRGWKNLAATLANGMRVDFFMNNTVPYNLGQITVDVNGSKGPNTWGRDVFMLRILSNGHVVPTWGSEQLRWYAEYNGLDPDEIVERYLEGYKNQCSTTSTSNDGFTYCATRIIENGWNMDY